MSTFTATNDAVATPLFLYPGESLTVVLSGGSGIVELQRQVGGSAWLHVGRYYAMGTFRHEQAIGGAYRLFARKINSTITYTFANATGDVLQGLIGSRGSPVIEQQDDGTLINTVTGEEVGSGSGVGDFQIELDNDATKQAPNTPILIVPAEANVIYIPTEFAFGLKDWGADYENLRTTDGVAFVDTADENFDHGVRIDMEDVLRVGRSQLRRASLQEISYMQDLRIDNVIGKALYVHFRNTAGGLLTVSLAGTAPAGTSAQDIATVDASSNTGIGFNGLIQIGWNAGVYTFDHAATLGTGFQVGDILVFPGTIVGGLSPDNDITATVTATQGGALTGGHPNNRFIANVSCRRIDLS